MPADYDSTARALALPLTPPQSPLQQHRTQAPWTRRYRSLERRSSDRLLASVLNRTIDHAENLYRQLWSGMAKLTPLQLGLSCVLVALSVALAILFLVFGERIFAALEPVAERWKNLRGGWLILWTMTFFTAFPPVIGYSTCLTLAGFVYGFPLGWPIVASATIAGSTLSFLLARTLLSSFVKRLVANDHRFEALSLVLKYDGVKLLIMIRLCPLPYSISNGAISTFPTVSWPMFAIATTAATPKLLIAVFVGSRLAAIAKSGEKMDATTKAINWISITIGVLLGVVTGYLIYQRTIARSRQIEAEEANTARTRPENDRGSLGNADDDAASSVSIKDDQIDFSERDSLPDAYHDEDETNQDDGQYYRNMNSEGSNYIDMSRRPSYV